MKSMLLTRLKTYPAAVLATATMLGLAIDSDQVDDATRLVPLTSPTLARYTPNWEAAQEDALALRPEMVMARQRLNEAEANLEVHTKQLRRVETFATGQRRERGTSIGTPRSGQSPFCSPGSRRESAARPHQALPENE